MGQFDQITCKSIAIMLLALTGMLGLAHLISEYENQIIDRFVTRAIISRLIFEPSCTIADADNDSEGNCQCHCTTTPPRYVVQLCNESSIIWVNQSFFYQLNKSDCLQIHWAVKRQGDPFIEFLIKNPSNNICRCGAEEQ